LAILFPLVFPETTVTHLLVGLVNLRYAVALSVRLIVSSVTYWTSAQNGNVKKTHIAL